MNELELKADLERALHKQITQVEWRHLKRAWMGEGTHSSDKLANDAVEDWQEFRDFAAEHLRLLRSYEEDKIREQRGELEPEMSPGPAPGPLVDPSSSLSDRTFARSQALAYLNQLRTGGRSSGRPVIYGTFLPRGGADGTLGQWVYIVAAELWVPAEEVMNGYRTIQRTLLADPKPQKTSGSFGLLVAISPPWSGVFFSEWDAYCKLPILPEHGASSERALVVTPDGHPTQTVSDLGSKHAPRLPATR